jgi:hypothetical protein
MLYLVAQPAAGGMNNTAAAPNPAECICGLRHNLSLNPDASPAALARRPLGAG